jgi:biopolymer transport protein TolQ
MMFDRINAFVNLSQLTSGFQLASGITSAAAPVTPTGSLSFLDLFFQADWLVKLVIIMLLAASVWSWAIIFDKIITLRLLKKRINSFEKAFWSGQPLDNLHKKIKGREDNPLSIIFSSAMHEWSTKSVAKIKTNDYLRASTKERINQAMSVAANKSLESIEKNLTFLAIVGSSTTFVGLFGTVWGIMNSFQAIAISKNTNLAVVAPGIAEALLATALGLATALPAMVFYNKFASEINKLSAKAEDFSYELSAIISKELDNI